MSFSLTREQSSAYVVRCDRPVATSLSLSICLLRVKPASSLAAVGFITNGPDQLKTRIQFGQFMNLPEAFAWQMREGGGVRALYGRAALFRAFYTGHGVLALNFMRHKVRLAAACAWRRDTMRHETMVTH